MLAFLQQKLIRYDICHLCLNKSGVSGNPTSVHYCQLQTCDLSPPWLGLVSPCSLDPSETKGGNPAFFPLL